MSGVRGRDCSPHLICFSFFFNCLRFVYISVFRSKHKIVLEFQKIGTKMYSKKMVLAVFRLLFGSLFISLFILRVDLDVFSFGLGLEFFLHFYFLLKRRKLWIKSNLQNESDQTDSRFKSISLRWGPL